ncbi:hypothetical protein STEG23_005485, partial [Scotinomys teguina]
MSGNQLFDRKMREGKEKVMARKDQIQVIRPVKKHLYLLILSCTLIILKIDSGSQAVAAHAFNPSTRKLRLQLLPPPPPQLPKTYAVVQGVQQQPTPDEGGAEDGGGGEGEEEEGVEGGDDGGGGDLPLLQMYRH